ncbi:MAG: aldo/keto reductase [Bacillota bacterium]|nr:aldo/keto reductase [Bacillota bacterium]
MDYRVLGKTGISVSRICFGSLTMGPLCANLPVEQGADILYQAFLSGINFVDTAEQYQTYPYIKAALDRLEDPQRIVVSTKTYGYTDQEAAWAVEDARLALGRNQLDIFLLHEVRDVEDFQEREGAWRILQESKANGVIRAVGISTHSAAVVAWAAEQKNIDIVHPLLNMSGIGILDGCVGDMLSAIRRAGKAGKGIFSMKALGGGALMHQARQALEWAFSQQALDAVAVGCKDSRELRTNLGWFEGREPEEAASLPLLDRNIAFDKEPRCHGCGACVERCAAGAMRIGEDGSAQWEKEKCIYCGYCIAACPWFCLSFC